MSREHDEPDISDWLYEDINEILQRNPTNIYHLFIFD
jgi:hypothetical protein